MQKLGFLGLLLLLAVDVFSCTSIVLRTQNRSPVYGRTMEWGAFDLKSELVMVPRQQQFTSLVEAKKPGLTWQNKFGFVAINVVNQPFVSDGMNEKGLVVGVLYFPQYASFQPLNGEHQRAINNIDLANYLLGNFARVDEIKAMLPKIKVVHNKMLDKDFGAPSPLHLVVTEESGKSIVIEYVKQALNIYDNNIGVMTNAPEYQWHIMNLKNYPSLSSIGVRPGKKIDKVDVTPFGAGSGLFGLPGDFMPTSRFVRAAAFSHASQRPKSIAVAIDQAKRILHNFDIPKGVVKEYNDAKSQKTHLNFTQWSVIADPKNKHYYYWTEFNQRIRKVDLQAIDFSVGNITHIPLDKKRQEDIEIVSFTQDTITRVD